jgi:hypothetical protein
LEVLKGELGSAVVLLKRPTKFFNVSEYVIGEPGLAFLFNFLAS